MAEQEKTTEKEMLEELKLIRAHLIPPKVEEEPEPEKEKKGPIKQLFSDFALFIRKYKVLGLVVAFIMSLYVKDLVDALVNDIIMPIFQYIPGLNQLDTLENWRVGYFLIGDFIATTISFLIVAFVVFLITKLGAEMGLESE
jgi:large conductance mechanosensitive channel